MLGQAGLEAARKSTAAEPERRPESRDSSDSEHLLESGPSMHDAARTGDLERIQRLAKHNSALMT